MYQGHTDMKPCFSIKEEVAKFKSKLGIISCVQFLVKVLTYLN